MTVIATALKHLMAAGLTGDALVTAVTEIEEAMAAKKGSAMSGAERTARWRERQRESQSSDESDVTSSPPSQTSPEKEKSPEPPKEKTIPPSARVDFGSDQEKLAFDAYNDAASECGLSRAQALTADRRRKITARLSECGGLPGWQDALGKIRGSPFLRGDNDRGWKASLDFLLQQSSFTRLMEGTYDRQQRTATARKNGSLSDAIALLDDTVDEAIRLTIERGEERGEADTGGVSGLRKSAA